MFSHLSFFSHQSAFINGVFQPRLMTPEVSARLICWLATSFNPTAGYSSTIGALRSERWDLALHFLYEAQAAMSFQRKEGDLPSGK